MTWQAAGCGQLTEFAAEVFAPLTRSDQRQKAELYLRGLLTAGRRKSMRPMARRLGVDHQALQQFITSSPWDLGAVRARLVRTAVGVVRPYACVVDEIVFRKDGSGSACVARQRVGSTGRTVNCQLGVALHLVGPDGVATVNWRLLVPPTWDDRQATTDQRAAELARRRIRCGIPDSERTRQKWLVVTDMLRELANWGVRVPAVVVRPEVTGAEELSAELVLSGVRCAWPPEVGVATGPSLRPADFEPQVDQARAELLDGLGLDHFEGRSWIGWNRHVTMASAAQIFRAGVFQEIGEFGDLQKTG